MQGYDQTKDENQVVKKCQFSDDCTEAFLQSNPKTTSGWTVWANKGTDRFEPINVDSSGCRYNNIYRGSKNADECSAICITDPACKGFKMIGENSCQTSKTCDVATATAERRADKGHAYFFRNV